MSQQMMQADIAAIVDDLKHVTLQRVIFEAITNALQANATEITVNLINEELEDEGEQLDSNEKIKRISQLVIQDNGDGFTTENTESFGKYRTQYKKQRFGTKGVGRFLYLKVFEEVVIFSKDKKITFTKEKDLLVEECQYSEKGAVLLFNTPIIHGTYLSHDQVYSYVSEHFLAYFKLLKDESKSATIKIQVNGVDASIINSGEIPDFSAKEFIINEHLFKIYYVCGAFQNSHDGYYCGNNRVVIKNSELDGDRKFDIPKWLNINYLLVSEYFDKNINDERDDFTIFPRKTVGTQYGNVSWSHIHKKLLDIMVEIAKEQKIDFNSKAEQELKLAITEAPFLVGYLESNNEFQDKEHLIHQAKKKLEEDKIFLRDKANQNKAEFQEKLAKATQSELAEYIFDRQAIIERLKSLIEQGAIEKAVHDLFMQQHTEDDKKDYKTNNLWLFDDRFMTYNKVFSESQLSKIFPDLPDIAKRPDILSIFSNTYEENEITDIVIVELKKPVETITPAGAEEQLLRYSSYINKKRETNKKIRVWTYAFLKFNEETESDLDNKSYNKIPVVSGYPIYYSYFEKPNTIINFIDYRSLAADANARNRIFIDILSGKSMKTDAECM